MDQLEVSVMSNIFFSFKTIFDLIFLTLLLHENLCLFFYQGCLGHMYIYFMYIRVPK